MRTLLPALAILALSTASLAQWSKDPAANVAFSDGDGEEVQSKLAAVGDGTTYLSFFDSDPEGSPAFGYDVRLQRLDPQGRSLWADGGIVIADRGYSSTQDYGLDAGPPELGGDAFLAFRDDRFGGDRITVTRVLADGTQAWGPTGVQVTSGGGFVASPKVAATPEGGCVVGWTQDNTARVQRLDASGAPQWIAGGIAVPVAGSDTNSFSDVIATPTGEAVFSWVRSVGGFFGPRQLYTQKLNASGTPQWGAGIGVFTAGSLQIGNFPPLWGDGAGGALFTWYGTSPLEVYAQHVRSDGTQSFGTPGEGVKPSLDTTHIRVNPYLAYRQAADETIVFWVEQNFLQSMDGVFGQRLDGAGNRLWGNNGIEVVPVGSDDLTQVRVEETGDGVAVLWTGGPGFGQDQIWGERINWPGIAQHPIKSLATTPSSKDDLATSVGPFGDVFAVWDDNASGNPDVLGQNLLADGEVGPAAGGVSRTGGANAESFSVTVGGLGGELFFQIDVASTGHALGAVACFTAPAAIPFGTYVILVDVAGSELLGLAPMAGPVPSWGVPIPTDPAFCGVQLYTQGVHVDASLPLVFTNAVDVYLGL